MILTASGMILISSLSLQKCIFNFLLLYYETFFKLNNVNVTSVFIYSVLIFFKYCFKKKVDGLVIILMEFKIESKLVFFFFL